MAKHFYILCIFFVCCMGCEQTKNNQVQTKTEEKADFLLKKDALIGFHFLVHKEGYDPAESDQFLKNDYFPNWRDLVPGSRVHYLKGERGMHNGRDVFCWVFEDVPTRDEYWPNKDEASEAYTKRRKSIDWLYTDTTFYKHNSGWDSLSADYIVIEAGKPVTKDWLAKGSLVGLHHMKLKAGIDTASFEKFISETWAPNRSDAVPGSKVFFLKGIRGDHMNEYAFLWIIESVETRDTYWPQKDVPSDLYNELRDKWKWMYEEEHRGKFFEGWEGEEQSDFIVI